MLVASASLAHAGAAGENDQVGRLQATHHAVEIFQASREAGKLAVALEGGRRHVDGGRERLREALETGVIAPSFGQLVQPPLGVLDLIAWGEIDRRVVGDVDHVLADEDQVAPDRQVVDGLPIILGIDDGRCFGREPRQVLTHASARRCRRRREEGLQGDRRRHLAGADQLAAQAR